MAMADIPQEQKDADAETAEPATEVAAQDAKPAAAVEARFWKQSDIRL